MGKNRNFYYTFFVLIAGLALISLFVYTKQGSRAVDGRTLPFIKLGELVQRQVELSAKKWSEFQGGDGTVNLEEDVIKPAEKSKLLLENAFDGKENEVGDFGISIDEETQVLLRTGALETDEWVTAIRKINELKQGGSQDGLLELNRKVEMTQTKVKESMEKLIDLFQNQRTRALGTLNFIFWLATGLGVVFFSGLSFYIFRTLRKGENLASETKVKLDRDEKRMLQLTGFIESVSAGNYQVQLEESSQDHVTETLVRMRAKLQENAELEQRRNWATSGQAEIGEILRGSSSSSELFDNIIRFIVKYTKSNQGGLFILNDDDSNDIHLDLVACYAFERKKFLTKKVGLGSGIVGQSFLERARIHLTEVPEDYVNITSGLGGTNPKSILVVPLKVNESVFGVLELASFQNYEDHEVDLVEKFGESIAATVSSVKINERTRELLEQTQQQAEEMKSQEEEMRQNMEELSATQEQLQRQMAEAEETKQLLLQRDGVFGMTTILSEADKFGTITYANNKLCQVSKYAREELIGQGHNIFRHPDMPKEIFKLMWDTIQRGETFRGIVKNRAKDGSHYWVDATITPVRNTEGEIYKYIGARYHITVDDLAEELYKKQTQRLGLVDLSTAS
jgi:methyl-accepting chemotaxis protein